MSDKSNFFDFDLAVDFKIFQILPIIETERHMATGGADITFQPNGIAHPKVSSSVFRKQVFSVTETYYVLFAVIVLFGFFDFPKPSKSPKNGFDIFVHKKTSWKPRINNKTNRAE